MDLPGAVRPVAVADAQSDMTGDTVRWMQRGAHWRLGPVVSVNRWRISLKPAFAARRRPHRSLVSVLPPSNEATCCIASLVSR
jgi:hypothetical protein